MARSRTRIGGAVVCLVLQLSLVAACGDDAGPGAGARDGYVSGTIRDERGQPIQVPGAKFSVSISGVADASAENVSYGPAVKADGTYEAKVVDGTYRPIRATIEVSFNGSTYRFELHPVQGNTADRHSAEGIVQDFVWKLSGAIPMYAQNPDPSNHTHWYGGSVNVRLTRWREDLDRGVEQPPAGTKYAFTFTPTGRLIDGSEAKALTFERSWDERWGDLENNILNDVPVGVYELTGVELAPGGAQRALIFETEYAKYEAKAVVDFPYSEITHGPHVHILAFDRQ